MEEMKQTKIFAFVYFVGLCQLTQVSGIPQQGTMTIVMTQENNITAMSKIMYKNTRIYVSVDHASQQTLTFSWVLRYSPCSEEYLMPDLATAYSMYLDHPNVQILKEMPYNYTEYMKNLTFVSGSHLDLGDHTKDELYATSMEEFNSGQRRKKRDDSKPKTEVTKPDVTDNKKAGSTQKPVQQKHALLTTWRDGPYILVLSVQSEKPDEKFEVHVTIEMEGDHGLISAVDWPLLVFYGVMGVVYIVYGMVWLVLMACSWRDLLRVQFWIGGVILLGMLEKAVFYGEYQHVASEGTSVRGAIVFAELVSCVKRALARMLVIIVSLGFGIVKPRLGAAFHKVLFVGGVYFISSSVEGCYRAINVTQVNNSTILILNIPLAVIDAVICWWIFSSLVQTTRTLRLRRNVVKMSLYRHFTNLLIFAVLSSVIFMLWSLVQHKFKTCMTDWQEIWIDDAFWHLLFSVILLVMMFLWRPSANSQRYAFSPLLDADEEEDETSINDAFDGMKMRSVKGQPNGSPKQRSNADDDLKWVEENIPSSITDKVLPSLLDSDEEIMTTKYEANKMQ